MSKWHTVSMKVTDEQLAAMNLRLQQLGFATMGDYARALTEGVVGNRQLVEDLAEALADRIVVKMTTSAAPAAAAAHEDYAVAGNLTARVQIGDARTSFA